MPSARVLIVDDDPIVLDITSKYLRKIKSYEVLSASSPAQALEIIKSELPVDLVISDVEMPEMSGPEFLNEIAQVSPRTASMLMSGSMMEDEILPLDVPFLQKPFTSDELYTTVARVLADSKQLHDDFEQIMETNAELSKTMERLSGELSATLSEVSATIRRARETVNSRKQREEHQQSEDTPRKDS